MWLRLTNLVTQKYNKISKYGGTYGFIIEANFHQKKKTWAYPNMVVSSTVKKMTSQPNSLKVFPPNLTHPMRWNHSYKMVPKKH